MLTFRPLSVAAALQLFQLMRVGAVLLGSVLLARSPLPIEAIGHFETLLFIGSIAAFFWANGLLQGIVPSYSRLPEGERPAFLFQVFILFAATAAAICGLLWTGHGALFPLLAGGSFPVAGWELYLVYLFVHLATLPLEFAYALQQRVRLLVGWGLLSFGGYVVALAVPAFAGWGLKGCLWGLSLLSALRCVWCVATIAGSLRRSWHPLWWRQYLRFSAPLVLNLTLGQAVVLFDSWLVGWYFRDEAIFALYRYGSREFPLALALASGLSTALTARIAAQPVEGLEEMWQQSLRLFRRVFPVSIGLVFCSSWLFRHLFGPSFEPAAALFNIYLLLTISRVLLPNTIVLAHGHPRAILAVGMMELVMKIVLGWLFIHWWGLVGVAWSAVLAFFWEKAALAWYAQQHLGIPVVRWLPVRAYAAYSATLLLAWAIVERWDMRL